MSTLGDECRREWREEYLRRRLLDERRAAGLCKCGGKLMHGADAIRCWPCMNALREAAPWLIRKLGLDELTP